MKSIQDIGGRIYNLNNMRKVGIDTSISEEKTSYRVVMVMDNFDRVPLSVFDQREDAQKSINELNIFINS